MSDYSELLQTIKQAAKEAVDADNPCGVLFGTVTSNNPLQINIEQKMTLSKEFLILTKNVVDYNVDVSINWTTNEKSLNANHNHSASDGVSVEQKNIDLTHSHVINGRKQLTIHNSLKNGDKVILIQVQGGQKYVVLDKIY